MRDNELQTTKTPLLVDTASAVAELVSRVVALPRHDCLLFIDLAGDRLSRDGTISLLQLLLMPDNVLYMIDIDSLKWECFSVNGYGGWTLKQVLESPQIVKVFFDVRNDSAALHACYDIKLEGVQDLQLMELATRTSKKYVHGLRQCVEKSCRVTDEQKKEWVKNYVQGLNFFVPARGGMFDIFNRRPVIPEIEVFCAQQVCILPLLWQEYNFVLSHEWQSCATHGARQRITASQYNDFNGIGMHMTAGPHDWQ